VDPRLDPAPGRLAEIHDVYRMLGLDPAAPRLTGFAPIGEMAPNPVVVTPLLSNNSTFD
jgi:hypothetical protein